MKRTDRELWYLSKEYPYTANDIYSLCHNVRPMLSWKTMSEMI